MKEEGRETYFAKHPFTPEQILQTLDSGLEDLEIARTANHPKVRFNYSYNALLKSGIALIAFREGLKVKSRPGHHVKILEKLSKGLKDKTILDVGDKMRRDRNFDLYAGGGFVSESESREYFDFVEKILKRVREMVKHGR